jgi:hypothetical protein
MLVKELVPLAFLLFYFYLDISFHMPAAILVGWVHSYPMEPMLNHLLA